MIDAAKRLFVGIKISKSLQHELHSPAPGTQHYFEGSDTNDFLQIISVGEQKFIGRYIKDGFPATSIVDVSRNVCSILKLITRGRRIEDNDVEIYSC
jgi:hypothetical protein